MRNLAAATMVFVSGFVIMVLEVVGTRWLAPFFGSSFEVWVSQIGLVLVALGLGYFLGGAVADRGGRLLWLAWLLWLAGVFIYAIPVAGNFLVSLIVNRHPVDVPIPPLWLKLDPVIGSAVVFLVPCAVLAMLSPFFIRLAARSLAQVGRASGLIFAASTAGSIAGVFISGFVLIEYMTVSRIFNVMGAATILLGLACLALDGFLSPAGRAPAAGAPR
jgi:MFS family permease